MLVGMVLTQVCMVYQDYIIGFIPPVLPTSFQDRSLAG